EFVEAKLRSNHGALLQQLANLADGTRTIPEITACLSLDFRKIFDVSDIERAIGLLEKAGYIKASLSS
ncbi:hypothetical protein KAH43_07140, partial [Candidatus Bipolaricaulota bacterium]|nr:hypothetical protein [Candidatus Bipolaricaulota bacterium]